MTSFLRMNKFPCSNSGRNYLTVGDSFSLTKWIHLNDGDDGLLELFRRVNTVLRPGGIFILEPQEWETYAKAKRMDAVRVLPVLHALL